jgi:putative hydroxymethylpyrimidine transport system ATP-binding protein
VCPDLHIVDASLRYQQQLVFTNINLTILSGRHLAILGRSGVGKTSFLRMLAGLSSKDEFISGDIRLSDGRSLQQEIAYLTQQDCLLPWLTTWDNIILPVTLGRYTQTERMRKFELAELLLKETQLTQARDLYPHQLSGGMRKRAALARTLLLEKSIILLDEPFSALDTITRHQIELLAHGMLRSKTVIYITHDPAEALRLADDIYLMHGDPATIELILQPQNSSLPRDASMQDFHIWYQAIFARLSALSEAA